MCGSPVYDYEHIDGFGVTGHDPDRMTLLCPDHHREKTAGRLPVAAVKRANANPFNASASFSKAHGLYFDGEHAALDFGNLRLEAVGVVDDDRAAAVIVDGAIVLGARITGGHLRLDMNVRDADNRTLLSINDGWLRVATENWDVEFVGNELLVRRENRVIFSRIELDPPHRVSIDRGSFYFNHVPIRVGSDASFGGLQIAERNFAQLTLQDGSITVEAQRVGYPTGVFLRDSPRHYGSPSAPTGGSFSRSNGTEVAVGG